jgi:hypothetical protein
MYLSAHFQLSELCASQYADRHELDNTPSQPVIDNLVAMCHGLEMIRALLGCPIYISSGYRSRQLNKAVGGSQNPISQHTLGQAADISAPAFGDAMAVMNVIIANRLPYDQCILEYYQPATPSSPARGWCHVSFVREAPPRQQALVIDNLGTRGYA